MATLIFLIMDIGILVILPYKGSFFITSELYIRPSNTNTRETMTLFKIIITITIMAITTALIIMTIIMISTTIFRNITEKLEKMRYFVFEKVLKRTFFYLQFWACYAAQIVMCLLRVWKLVIKI